MQWRESAPATSPETYESPVKVLGAQTTDFLASLSSIPSSSWVLLIAIALAAFFLFITIRILVASWAGSALIYGIDAGMKGEAVTLANTSPQGKAYMKRFAGLSFLVIGIFMGTMVAIGLIWGLGYLLFTSSTLRMVWAVIGGLAGVIVFLVTVVLLWAGSTYAERYIVFENMSVRKGLTSGVHLARQNMGATIVMAIINSFIGFGVGLGSLLLLSLPVIVGMISGDVNAATISLGGVYFLALIVVLSIVSAGMSVFSNSNWNLMFQTLTKNNKVEE